MKKYFPAVPLALLIWIVGCPNGVLGSELRSTIHDQESIAVTIYNDELALVKEIRKVNLPSGEVHIALRDVSGRLRPETAQLRSLTLPGALQLLEQNFDFDLLTPQKLLEKSVGQTVRVIRTNSATGTETTESAEVLSVAQGVVLKIGDRIETGIPGRLVFDQVPSNLRDRPTLVVNLENNQSAEHRLELSYLTGGLSWKADYVAELNADDNRLDLNGWVTLTNTSGTTYPMAKLQLVAGDVNRVADAFYAAAPAAKGMLLKEEAKRSRMSEEGLFEYHLYSLDRPTTVANNQTKQVALLSATTIPVKKQLTLFGNDYYYRSSYGELGQKMKLDVTVEFDNKESSQLGVPLPKGVVRVYKRDKQGNAQFIGEDRIDHTAKNELVKLKLGSAFDVTADKKQTDFKRADKGDSRLHVYESAYEIKIKNAKSEAVKVNIQEPIPGDWHMMNETHAHSKPTAHTAHWQIAVPANGQTVLRYRVQCKF